MLGVDEAGGAASLLHLGHHVQGQSGLARAFRTVDLDDAPARQAADAERHVEAQRTGGDGLDLDDLALLPEFHHRALAEGPVDLGERRFESALLIAVFLTHEAQHRLRHWKRPSYPILPKAPASVRRARPCDQDNVHCLFLFAICSFRKNASKRALVLGRGGGDEGEDGRGQGLALADGRLHRRQHEAVQAQRLPEQAGALGAAVRRQGLMQSVNGLIQKGSPTFHDLVVSSNHEGRQSL